MEQVQASSNPYFLCKFLITLNGNWESMKKAVAISPYRYSNESHFPKNSETTLSLDNWLEKLTTFLDAMHSSKNLIKIISIRTLHSVPQT